MRCVICILIRAMFISYLVQRSKAHNNQHNVLQPAVSNNTYEPAIQTNGKYIIYNKLKWMSLKTLVFVI